MADHCLESLKAECLACKVLPDSQHASQQADPETGWHIPALPTSWMVPFLLDVELAQSLLSFELQMQPKAGGLEPDRVSSTLHDVQTTLRLVHMTPSSRSPMLSLLLM